MPGVIATRYSKALAKVVPLEKDSRKVQQELKRFTALLDENPELWKVLTSPAFPLPRRKAVLQAVLAKLKTSKVGSNFLLVLLDNFRLEILQEICDTFNRIVDDRSGMVRVRVSAADNVGKKQQESMRKSFEKLTSRKVELVISYDPSLLGGAVARVGSTVYDGSLKNRLERLSEHLYSGSL